MSHDSRHHLVHTTSNLRSLCSLYDRVIAETDVAIVSVDNTGVIIGANPAMEGLLGYAPKTLSGRNILDIFPAELGGHVFRRARDHSSADTVNSQPVRRLTALSKSGDEIATELTIIESVIDDRPQITAIVKDTDRTKNDINRKAAEAQLNQLIETANAPIWGVNMKGQLDTWNFSAEAVSGYSRNTAMNMDLVEEMIIEQDKPLARDTISKAMMGIESENIELNLTTKDGRQITLLTSVATRRSPDGEPVGVLGVAQDVTDMRSREAALQHAQRTEALGTLAGGITHVYNNLLSVIEGNLRFLLDQSTTGSDRDGRYNLMEDALSAAREAIKLTRSLTSYTGSFKLASDKILLDDLLEDFLMETNREFGPRFPVTLNRDGKLACIYTCARTFRAVLHELCSNARESMPDGGDIVISYRVHTSRSAIPADLEIAEEYLELTVTDSGSGVDPQDMHNAFDPFFTTKPGHKGLGLSMAAGFARQSGGKIILKSIPDVGSKAYVYLPTASPQASNSP